MNREVEPSSDSQQVGWHALTWQECVARQHSESRQGLSEESVRERQKEFGSNSIPVRTGPHAIIRFLLQFHQPLLYILLASAIITAAMKEWVDASVIFGVLLINAIIGYLQESKAAKALEALVRTTSTEARVIRAGVSSVIPSPELVPGDLVLLQSGDKVPADLRLTISRELQIDESCLTGESVPASKIEEPLPTTTPLAERSNMAFASTLVTYGQGTGIVIATGANTEVGRISELISSAEALQTPLTKKISRFSRWLLVVILILAAVTFAVGWWRAQPLSELFMATVALAVGAIPEGLPAAVTITLAIGVARMARRRSIVRKLPAVETLGSTTVICSDKTGTLTVNQMTVREVWSGSRTYEVYGTGYEMEGELRAQGTERSETESNVALSECLRAGLFCNDAKLVQRAGSWQVEGDPTEGALISVAAKLGLGPDQAGGLESRIDVIPFESQHQYMATLHRGVSLQSRTEEESTNESDDAQVYVKGAAEVLLKRCVHVLSADGETIPIDAAAVRREVERMASQGLRVLAFAEKTLKEAPNRLQRRDIADLTLLGIQGMIDPPRPEAIQAIEACQNAGIRVKVITGDHPLTTHAIARQLGITESRNGESSAEELAAITSQELEACDDQSLVDIADRVTVFARATPELKLRLVRALQTRGNVIAMTGDGVNDAPALKQADIGVAMGVGGTEVAKEAADMVLTDDNFASIEAAVEEGRGVFDNLTKYIVWTLPTSMGEGLVVLAAIFAGVPLPILPVQILWINMTTAVLLGLMLAFEPKEHDIMRRPPRDPAAPILTPELIGRILMVSVVMLVGAFGSFRWAIDRGLGEEVARTISANVFVFVELFYLFNCRSLTRSMFQQGLFSNRWIWVGVAGMVILQLAFTYLPPMNQIFRTAPIDLDAWWRILLTGVATYALVGFEKSLRAQVQRWKSRGGPSKGDAIPTSLPSKNVSSSSNA